MVGHYNRFKACPPEETVQRIKNILENLGITPVETWFDSGVEGFYSLRIELEGVPIGQNGKGTTRSFARASGYAEIMERLQIGLLYQGEIDTHAAMDEFGFVYFPDEIHETPEKLAHLGGDLLKKTLHHITVQDSCFAFLGIDAEAELNKWMFAPGQNTLCALPFTSMKDGSVCYMPYDILTAYFFTNGSCAGNSKEEALVQGISEIMERYASNLVTKKGLCLPQIPKEQLQKTPLCEAIQEINEEEGFSLRIMDASCGMGLPVVASVLIDHTLGRYIFRFGAHPRFEIALERSLTEILQGKNIREMSHAPEFDVSLDDYAQSTQNRFNFMKASYGVLPSAVFANAPSYEYSPPQSAPENTQEQLSFLMKKAEELGFDLYVRDASYLGFHTYQVLAPGHSMAFDFGSQRLKEKKLHSKVLPLLRNLRCATPAQWEELLPFLKMKQNWIIENSFQYLARIPYQPKLMGTEISADLLMVLHLISQKEYAKARDMLLPYKRDAKGVRTPFFALHQVLALVARDPSLSDLQGRLCAFVPEEELREAIHIVQNPKEYLPKLSCFDCACCESKKTCAYTQWMSIQRKLNVEKRNYIALKKLC